MPLLDTGQFERDRQIFRGEITYQGGYAKPLTK
jgi:hypothetical protein